MTEELYLFFSREPLEVCTDDGPTRFHKVSIFIDFNKKAMRLKITWKNVGILRMTSWDYHLFHYKRLAFKIATMLFAYWFLCIIL